MLGVLRLKGEWDSKLGTFIGQSLLKGSTNKLARSVLLRQFFLNFNLVREVENQNYSDIWNYMSDFLKMSSDEVIKIACSNYRTVWYCQFLNEFKYHEEDPNFMEYQYDIVLGEQYPNKYEFNLINSICDILPRTIPNSSAWEHIFDRLRRLVRQAFEQQKDFMPIELSLNLFMIQIIFGNNAVRRHQ